MANLGRKPHAAGNTIVYDIDYDSWLPEGVNLSTANVTLNAGFTATVTDITISAITVHARHFTFKLAGGSLNETFTLDVQAVDSKGEIKNDTCGFTVIAP